MPELQWRECEACEGLGWEAVTPIGRYQVYTAGKDNVICELWEGPECIEEYLTSVASIKEAKEYCFSHFKDVHAQMSSVISYTKHDTKPFLSFCRKGDTNGLNPIGSLLISGNKLDFEGDVNNSARIFFEEVIAIHSTACKELSLATLEVLQLQDTLEYLIKEYNIKDVKVSSITIN